MRSPESWGMTPSRDLHFVVTLALSFGLLLGGPGPGSPSRGKAVLVQSGCLRCHSIWGSGNTVGPDLARVVQSKTLLQIAGSMWNHAPQMDQRIRDENFPRPAFTPSQMDDLMSYLYSLTLGGEAGDPRRGERLFEEKHCARCHNLKGRGGNLGPALDRYQAVLSPLFIAQSMWNHGSRMSRAMRQEHLSWPLFRGSDMADLLAYVRSQTPAAIQEQWEQDPGDPEGGARLFQAKGCARCHVGEETGRIGPDLARSNFQRSATQIAGIMWNHGPRMWAEMGKKGVSQPILEGREMADLIAYLSFLRSTDREADPKRGRRVLQSKGCLSCHGTASGPPVLGAGKFDSPAAVASALWNHAPAMEKAVLAKRIAWPQFQGNELRDLVAYLSSKPR